MPGFLVQWEIDVEADTPLEAAQQAFNLMRLPDTTTTVFDVIEHDSDGEAERIDLLEHPQQGDESCPATQ